MTRKSFLIRHVRIEEPDEVAAAKYLRLWSGGELWNNLEDFPRLTSEQIFGNNDPLELEVGCSTGEYLCSLAHENPGRNYIGVEINLKSLHVAVANANELKLDNILFIKAAIQSLYRLMPDNSLAAAYMHFPDPYLHPRFRPKRMFTTAFLDAMYSALAPEGTISIVTDKEPLFWDMLGIVEKDTRFRKTHSERYLTGFEPTVKSRYQAYWEKHGLQIYRFVVRKTPA